MNKQIKKKKIKTLDDEIQSFQVGEHTKVLEEGMEVVHIPHFSHTLSCVYFPFGCF